MTSKTIVYTAYVFAVLFAGVPIGRAQNAAPPPTQANQQAPSVLVLPFASLNDDAQREWISRAIQQNFVAELGDVNAVRLIAPASAPKNAPPVDLQGALQAARDARATLVVFGNYQVVDQDVRVTGQVVDGQSGQIVGNVKATGRMAELFAIEDSLADQVVHIVAPGAAARAPSDDTVTSNYQPVPQTAYTPAETTYAPPQTSTYAYPPTYYPDTYSDSYPYESYSYSSAPAFWWPSPFVSLGAFFVFDDHHGHHDHHEGEHHDHSPDHAHDSGHQSGHDSHYVTVAHGSQFHSGRAVNTSASSHLSSGATVVTSPRTDTTAGTSTHRWTSTPARRGTASVSSRASYVTSEPGGRDVSGRTLAARSEMPAAAPSVTRGYSAPAASSTGRASGFSPSPRTTFSSPSIDVGGGRAVSGRTMAARPDSASSGGGRVVSGHTMAARSSGSTGGRGR